MNTPKQTKNALTAPNTPHKKPSYSIPASSPYYSSEEENENIENNINGVEEVNTAALVNLVQKRGVGNTHGPLGFHPQINLRAPTMKLPTFVKGGKRSRRKSNKSRKAKKTRKH